jgi:hypothetical protein
MPYLAVHAWQINHIKDGLRQSDPDAFATDAEVAAAYYR